jgi:hypothetical protein
MTFLHSFDYPRIIFTYSSCWQGTKHYTVAAIIWTLSVKFMATFQTILIIISPRTPDRRKIYCNFPLQQE